MEKVKVLPKLDESDLYILGVLYATDAPCYGLEILSEIERLTEGAFEIKQPTLYSKLKSLISAGLVEVADADLRSKGGKRNHVQITPKGKEIFVHERGIWEFERTLKDRLISPKTVDLKNPPVLGEVELSRPLNKGSYYIIDDRPTPKPEVHIIVAEPKPETKSEIKEEKPEVKGAKPEAKEVVAETGTAKAEIKEETLEVKFKEREAAERVAAKATEAGKKTLSDYKFCLAADGYTVKTYSAANGTAYYRANYFNIARLIRDCSLLLFLSVIIETLAFMLFDTDKEIANGGYYATMLVALALPIGGLIYAMTAKNNIKKDGFSFNSALLISLLSYLLLTGLSLLIMTLANGSVNFSSAVTYAPAVLLVNIPLAVIYYAALLNSKKYHVKN